MVKVALHCVAMCCVVLCWFGLHSDVLCCYVVRCISLYWNVCVLMLFGVVLYDTSWCCGVLCCSLVHRVVVLFCCIVLFWFALHCIL